jgi:HEAT repeat protein
MDPRRKPLAWLLVVLALGVLLWFVFRPGGTDAPQRPAAVLDEAAVLAAFQSEDPADVRRALADLRRLDPAPVAFLLEGLRHPNRGVREWSAHALGDAAPTGDGVVKALLELLEDRDDLVRWKAVRALGLMGSAAAAALPPLRQVAATDQEHEIVRAAAQHAIEQIAGD